MLLIRKAIADKLKEAGHTMPLFKGAVAIGFVFSFPVMVNQSLAKKLAQHNRLRPQRPDLDNLEKQICDALNGVLWSDDARVALKLSTKVYTIRAEGSTDIYAYALDDEKQVNFEEIAHVLATNMRLPDA